MSEFIATCSHPSGYRNEEPATKYAAKRAKDKTGNALMSEAMKSRP